MWNIIGSILGVILIILSIEDCLKRYISVKYLWLMGGCVVAYFIITKGGEGLFLSGLGMLCGVVFLGISAITKEKIGYGDSIVLIILGGYLGIWVFLDMMTLTCILCFIFGIICLIRKKTSLTLTTIPFLPFIFMGFLGVMVWSYL